MMSIPEGQIEIRASDFSLSVQEQRSVAPMNLFRKLAGSFVNRALIPFLGYVRYRIHDSVPPYGLLEELTHRTAAECADYVQTEMGNALEFKEREDLWDYVWTKKNPAGLIAEFGVWNGYSINRFAEKTAEVVFGFDSFVGLREDWKGAGHAKGTFDVGGKLPKVRKNVDLIEGWFDETLPPFLAGHGEEFAFIHVDCDTYEAAAAVLSLVGPRIKQGTVIVFDEYFGYRGWRCGEFKAWQEFVSRNQIHYEYLAFSRESVSVQITQNPAIAPHSVEL
jgi:hypothetical protein